MSRLSGCCRQLLRQLEAAQGQTAGRDLYLQLANAEWSDATMAPLCRRCIDDLILDLMPDGLETAQPQGPPSGRSIRIVTAPVFLTTKLEECRLSQPALRNDLASQFHELLNTSAFLEALPDLLDTMRAITALAEP